MIYMLLPLIWFAKLTLNILGCLLGLVIVPIALLIPNDDSKYLTFKANEPHVYWLRRLPTWAKWWDNPIDGTLGDDDFRWASRDIPFGLKNTSFLGQFWWMAVRNPFNYFKRFVLGCDVRKHPVKLLWGDVYVRDDYQSQGAQLLGCGHNWHFYMVRRWGNSKRAIVIELGNKFDLEDNKKTYSPNLEYKYFKGFTFEINPFKDIS